MAGDWKVGDVLHIVAREVQANEGPSEDSVKEFADRITSQFKVVVWDMDQCAVCQHSMGSLRRSSVESFAQKVSPDFVMAVKELAMRKVGLAIATHSDLAEHSSFKPRDTH